MAAWIGQPISYPHQSNTEYPVVRWIGQPVQHRSLPIPVSSLMVLAWTMQPFSNPHKDTTCMHHWHTYQQLPSSEQRSRDS